MLTPSMGAKLLSEVIAKRNLSYRDAANEILEKSGVKVLRFSVYQWAHDVSRPNLRHALAIEKWSGGKISPESWGITPKTRAD